MQKFCKICGTPFECVHGAGAYCSIACRKMGVAISKRKYQTKQAQIKTEPKAEIKTETPTNVVNRVATKIEYKKIETPTNDIVISELNKAITENLELLDAVRDELQKIVDDLKARQSAYDQKDIENLHLLEGATSDASLLEYAKKCKASRQNRRNYKNYISFLIGILKTIPVNTKDNYEKSKQVQTYRDTFYSIKY